MVESDDTLRKIRALLGAGEDSSGPTFGVIWQRYYREEARGHDTAVDIERRGRLLCAAWGKRPALQCDTAAAEDYRDLRYDTERSRRLYQAAGVAWRRAKPRPATINRELACARRCLQWALEQRLIRYNPLASVRLEEEDNVKQIGHRTEADLQRLLEYADPTERAAILLWLDCGPRRAEVLSLQWTQILRVKTAKGPRPVVMLWKTKGGEPRRIGISDRAYEAVMALPQVDRYVFPGRRPGGGGHKEQPIRPGTHLSPDTFLKRMQKLFRRAGILALDGKPLTIHDLRHWFVYSAKTAYGLGDEEIMAQTGHKTRSAFERYGIGGELARAQLYDRVNEAIKKEIEGLKDPKKK